MPRRKGPALDREQVVAAAIEVVNEFGPEACGVNRVARHLGIKPPSLYNHVEGNADLREAVALEGTRRLYGATTLAPGCDPLRNLANDFRFWVKANAGLYRLMSATSLDPADPRFSPTIRKGLDTYAQVMASRGLEGDAAIHAIRAVRSAVHGFVLLELEGQFRLGFDTETSWDYLIDVLLRGLQIPR